MKDDHSKKYIICPFCRHELGKATQIEWYTTTCPGCNEELDVSVNKYGIKVERHKEAS